MRGFCPPTLWCRTGAAAQARREGRGTDVPLKQVGAAWLTDTAVVADEMNGRAIPGIRFEAATASVAAGEKFGGEAGIGSVSERRSSVPVVLIALFV